MGRIQHIVTDLARDRHKVVIEIRIRLTVNTLKGRDVLRQRHPTVLNRRVGMEE